MVTGTATVSDDGQTLVSNEGVRTLGWRSIGANPGTSTSHKRGDDPKQPDDEDEEEEEDCSDVVVRGGRGDVIRVDLGQSGCTMFERVSLTGGQVVYLGESDVGQGVFYFVPETTVTDPFGLIQATFRGKRSADGETDESVLRIDGIDVEPGYSSTGPNAVTFGTGQLDNYRQQQRLRFLGYHDQTGNNAQLLSVDGIAGPKTRHAIGVFNAAVLNSDRVDENASVPNAAINSPNAPRWVPVTFGAGIVDGQNVKENWLTHWARAVLDAADAQSSTPLVYTGGSMRGGGDTPFHETHEAGMDIDINIDQANLVIGQTPTLTPTEQFVLDQMLAFHRGAGASIERIIISYARLRDAFNAQTMTTIATVLPGHFNHFHVDVKPQVATSAQVGGEAEAGMMSTVRGFGADSRLYYRFSLPGGVELAGRTNAQGQFTTVLPTDSEYTLTLYDASTNRSGVYRGISGASGATTRLGTLILDQFGGLDADGDRIPDVGERAIGTDPNQADTDGDGISDSTEIEQSLNPLDDRESPVGVTAATALDGAAQEVVVEAESGRGGRQLAYLATGDHGLAVVDVSRFNSPVVLGQVDLPGFNGDVAVDAHRELAVLAAGDAGLHFVNVEDPMLPRRIATRRGAFSRVELHGGIAVVASGAFVQGFDAVSADQVFSLTL
ncbi:MAG: hypothetical protein KY475_15520, partial [Planctomycetes bacterium]|nr:hypothetical protein [Planctomycetota bacterium]